MMSSKRFCNVRYLNTASQLARRTPWYLNMFWTLLVIIYVYHSLQKEREIKCHKPFWLALFANSCGLLTNCNSIFMSLETASVKLLLLLRLKPL